MTKDLRIPRMAPGRPSKEALAWYATEMEGFAGRKIELQHEMHRKVRSRGWYYLLEDLQVIKKGDCDLVEQAINDCRLNANDCRRNGCSEIVSSIDANKFRSRSRCDTLSSIGYDLITSFGEYPILILM
jgi:hypothetical protein